MNLPWIESPLFNTMIESKNLSEKLRQLCKDYNENGFVIIRGLISDFEVNEIKEDITEFFPEKLDLDVNRNQDLWRNKESVKKLAINTKIIETLRVLYDREPIPFQTLNFKYGSQQKTHSDSIHFNSIPERFMCGVWVALEDTNEENGPLIYYPGSHIEKQFNYFDLGINPDNPGDGDGLKKGSGYSNYGLYETCIEEIIKNKDYKPQELHLKKGDALIWSSNLLHGGKPVINKSLTRWSQVTHYYFDNCLYFTPMWSKPESGEYFLRQITDISTGENVENRLNGKTIQTLYNGNGNFIALNKIDPSLLKNLSWKQISVLLKDRVKFVFRR